MSDTLYKKVMNVIASLEKMADFMEPEMFQGSMWVGESMHGSFMYPANYFSKEQVISEEGGEDSIYELELQEGIWARMSAPGYLDSTDWGGPFESEEEAEQYLEEMYGYEDYE